MLKIGVTGGIGSGKSYICNVFKHIGIPVYNSDVHSNILVENDKRIIKKMKELFGNEIYNSFGHLNKSKISDIIFNNETDRKKVNSIIHPVVLENFIEWTEYYENTPFIIFESALLFESNFSKSMDKIICITAPIEERIERIIKRDKISVENIKKIINAQITDEIRISKSNYIINSSNSEMKLPKIIEIYSDIIIFAKK